MYRNMVDSQMLTDQPATGCPWGKRYFDVAFSLLVLILLSPVFALLALAIRINSPGSVFFSQTRIGRNGAPFTLYKFRTMHAATPQYAVTPKDDFTDTRVTGVGRLLRKSGLDELPQFLNVLKGEMSVVGPRPEMPFLVEHYTPRQRRRLQVQPGVTGLWQISPARRDPIHENLEYDEYYIEHCSLWLDLLIVFRTVLLAAWAILRSVAYVLGHALRGRRTAA